MEGTALSKGASTQMNTRIGAELKAHGDAVFASLGLTASQAVRRFYEFAAACSADPDRLERVLSGATASQDADIERSGRIARRLELVESGSQLYAAALERLGVETVSSGYADFVNQPYDELCEAALLDEYRMEDGA